MEHSFSWHGLQQGQNGPSCSNPAMAGAAAPVTGQFFSVLLRGVSVGSDVEGDSLQLPLQPFQCFYKHWTLPIKSLSA